MARKCSRLFVIILVGSMIGVACFHFLSSLLVLYTTTDLVLLKTMRLPADHGDLVALRANRDANPRDQRSYSSDEKDTASHDDYSQKTNLLLNIDTRHEDSEEYNEPPQSNTSPINTQAEVEIGVAMQKASWDNMTVSEREQFQQNQVDLFCSRNYLDMERPVRIARHMLLNDKSETAFCFAPKVGCTNLKILFFIAQGALPLGELYKTRDAVNQETLEDAIREFSFMGLSQERKKHILNSYYKFMMYRNPIERLISAYRSKVERFPLSGLDYEEPHYNWLRMNIYRYKHPQQFRDWHSAKGRKPINISFPDFIDYWLYRGGLKFDEHFQTIYSMCDPCQVRYDYYGNFNSFEKDAEVLMRHIGANSKLLRRGYYSEGRKTSELAPQYYSLLSSQQKALIVNKLALDLSFYYSIFPLERDSHKIVMGIDHEVPIFYH